VKRGEGEVRGTFEMDASNKDMGCTNAFYCSSMTTEFGKVKSFTQREKMLELTKSNFRLLLQRGDSN
jgi:hypothetical protein